MFEHTKTELEISKLQEMNQKLKRPHGADNLRRQNFESSDLDSDSTAIFF